MMPQPSPAITTMISLFIIRWSAWLFVVALLCSIFADDWDAMLTLLVSLTLLYQLMKSLWRDSRDAEEP
jgi:hypothetical protein